MVMEQECAAFYEPIDGNPAGKHVLSMLQFSSSDIEMYIAEAEAAQAIIDDPERGGVDLLRFKVLRAIMKQPSTRTGGSMTTAMAKLGGFGELISGMASSSEAKGESVPDSWLAFAAQSDVIGTRTYENYGSAEAAAVIDEAFRAGKLNRNVPIINLGDGTNEHPTQTLGDLYTIHEAFRGLESVNLTVVGDHERYRAFHSLLIGAATMGMSVTAVQCDAAPVPEHLKHLLGSSLKITDDLDDAMLDAEVLYIGRNPDEYGGDVEAEIDRSRALAKAYEGWVVDEKRLEKMWPDSIVLHPRPRRLELAVDADLNPRTRDVRQMANMVPMRMAILAGVFGKSIREALQ